MPHYFGARVMVIHIFGSAPKADIAVRFIFEPTDAGFLLTGVMFWIIGWVLPQALVLKDLAAEIGQSQRPRIRYFGKICRALHCQPGDLLEFLDVSTRADK